MVRALMGDLPCYGPFVPDILWYSNRFCPVPNWITAYLDSTPPTAAGNQWPSARARSDLLGAFSAGLSQDEFRLALRSFEALCARERLYRRQ